MKHLLTLFAILVALSSSAFAADGNYPTKPVRIIVPTAPGGGVDVLARLIGQKLGERFGEQFFIDNRPGAAGIIGTRTVTASAPDGYTLLMAPSSLAITAAIKKKMPYDLVRDLTPIMSVASTPYALIVNPSLPVQSVPDLIAYAKANPDKLNVSSAGVGSASHLAAELFDTMASIKMTHVPNKGMGPAMVDVLGGQVSVLFAGLPASLTAEKAGTVRVLAVAGPTRSVLLPEKPTIAEAGLPGYEVDNWIGMLAPAGLDPAIVTRLNSEIRAVLDAQDIKQKLIELGFEPVGGTPTAFSAQLASDVKKWGEIAKKAGVSED
ncbi:MAG TPA: tripartite tricarboxylate transporter substrate binding protein [Pseudolabrys sp.]|jgi:tripartite-type tricarboxylate transporter receptor subunit TctC|nr:tripartite tricarboxylate transporter substrate binding protein [Pseudolabrys sp.]